MARAFRYVVYASLAAAFLIWVFPGIAQQGTPQGQWRSYASEVGSTGYSALDQINRDNVKNLEIAWRWHFDNFGNTNSEVTPIMINDILYFPLSPQRTIIAANAGTGQTL